MQRENNIVNKYKLINSQTMFDSMLMKYAAMFGIIMLNTPMEIIKMRMVSNYELFKLGQITKQYESIRNCAKTILRDEGVLAFWKGNAIMLSRIIPIESINYVTRKRLHQELTNTLLNNIVVAIISGITASTLIYPTDIIRQIMNNNTKAQISILSTIKEIKRQHGYKYFYKGYPNLLLTLAVYRSSYNGTYDTNKVKAKNLKEKAIIAYICTVFAETVTYPVEIVRRRRIAINAKEGFLGYGKNIWQSEGVRGFFKGSSLIPFQSIGWSLILILFDTAGLHFQTAVDV